MEELNRAIQEQQKTIEENNPKLAMHGLPQLAFQVSEGQNTMEKCSFVGSVKVQIPQLIQASESVEVVSNTVDNEEELNRAIQEQQKTIEENNRKLAVLNNNSATISSSIRSTPQTYVNSSASIGITSQTTHVLNPGPRTNSVMNVKGNSVVVNQKSPVTQNPTYVQFQSGPSQPNQASGSVDQLSGEVSKDKVQLEGGGQFQEGEAYLVHSKDGRSRTMLFKNGKFIPYDLDKNLIQHSKIDSSQRGGRGRGRGQLQGNATGANMAQEGQDVVYQNSTGQTMVQQNATGQNMVQTVRRRPLHGDGQAGEESGSDKGSGEEKGTVTEKTETQSTLVVPNDPNIVAVCHYCAYTSTDKVRCERCHRNFTRATKLIKIEAKDAKRIKLDETKDSNGTAIDKKTFYSKKLEEQNQVYSQVLNAANSDSTTVLGTTRILSRGALSRGRMRGRGRSRGGRLMVPEIVTISSDEEEGSSCDKGSGSQPATLQASQGSQAGKGSAESQSPAGLECPESPLIPPIPISTKRPPLSRVEKMEDEMVTTCSSREQSLPPVQVLLTARTIHVGTFRGAPVGPIFLSKNGLSFYIEGVNGCHSFHIYPDEIRQCLVKFADVSLMFFLTSKSCGCRTRKDLGIPDHTNPLLPPKEPYFDPFGIDMSHKMITVLMCKVDPSLQLEFQRQLESFESCGKQGDEKFYMELSAAEASEIFRLSTKKVPVQLAMGGTLAPRPAVTADHHYSQAGENGKRSRSPSPPRIDFVGPVFPVEKSNSTDTCSLKDLLSEFQQNAVLSDVETKIIVFRRNILESTLRALDKKTLNLKARLYVKFSGEIGAEYGGQRMEFFRLAISALRESRFFEGPATSKIFTHDLCSVENNQYLLIGRLVALSMAQEGPGLYFMNHHLFDIMVGREINLTNADIPDMPRELNEMIQQLQDIDTHEKRNQFLADHGDRLLDQGLGKLHSLTIETKGQTIHMLKKHYLYYRISSEINQFIQGMNEVSRAWDFVKKNAAAFKPLFCHSPRQLSAEDMATLFRVSYSEEGTNARVLEHVTVYAWEVFLQSIDDGEVPVTFGNLLTFATGADQIPPCGFAKPIDIMFYSDRRLPSASTCALQLWLPRLEDPGSFSGMLVKAIQESGGLLNI